MIGSVSFRWSQRRAGRGWVTAVLAVPVLRPGNDRAWLRGAEGGERVVFHVVQGEDGLDHGGALFRPAPQLGGQDFPVLEARRAPPAHAPPLRLPPVPPPPPRGTPLPPSPS